MKREVALVTGASTGIGRACAEQLAAAGFAVYGTARRPGRSSGGVNMIPLDVRDDNSVMACVKRVLREAGQIDVLVNNAGVAMEGAIEETSLEEIRGVMETNFFGVVRMIRAVLPGMRQRGRGRIRTPVDAVVGERAVEPHLGDEADPRARIGRAIVVEVRRDRGRGHRRRRLPGHPGALGSG